MFPKCKLANPKQFLDTAWGLHHSKGYNQCLACLQQSLWWKLREFTIIDPSYSMLLVLMESSWAQLINFSTIEIALTVFFMQKIESEGSPHTVQTLSFLQVIGSK